MSINKIYIINFDDSFTYNIASIIYPHFRNIEVVDYLIFFEEKYLFLLNEINSGNKFVIILGPGPGHPNDYAKYDEMILKILGIPNFFIVGICLGHQILLSLIGYNVSKAHSLVHGERILINYKKQSIFVQRYNSLAPKTLKSKNEILLIDQDVYIYRDFNLLSFQFHPESIGTSNSQIFFSEIFEFIKS